MWEADRDYFYRRAEQEIALAKASEDPRIVNVHYTLAYLYLEKVFEEDDLSHEI
jgi:hypothetical protein